MRKNNMEFDELENSIVFYLNRPHPIYKIVTFLICTVFLLSVIFMCIGKTEVKIKGEGEVTKTSNITYVTNIIDGKIKRCYVQDGQEVKKGEILYEINHDNYDKKLKKYKKEKKRIKDKLNIMEAYERWLENPDNNYKFDNTNRYYEVYSEKCQYILTILSLADKESEKSIAQVKMDISNVKRNINILNKKVDCVRKAKRSVNKVKNFLTANEYCYYAVQKYIAEYSNIKSQYEDKMIDEENDDTIIKYKKQKKAQLWNLKEETLSTFEQMETELEDKKREAKNLLRVNTNNLSIFKNEQIENNNVNQIISNEKISVLSEREEKEAKLLEIEQNMEEQEKLIENSIVYATRKGYVNFLKDNIEADNYVYAGDQMMTILANGKEYFIEAYIKNSDIGDIRKGMSVKCEIAAFPYEEYGYLIGKIATISKTTKEATESGTYYKVKVELDDVSLNDEDGSKVEIMDGMACEIKIVTKEKKILKYVLEKVDLLD